MNPINLLEESEYPDVYPRNLVELINKLRRMRVPESEYYKYVSPFLERKARKMRIPISGTFELTPLCNFACKMCYVQLKPLQFSQRNLLPVDVWKKLISEAHEAGMINASLTGGECLTYPGFDEIYLYLHELGIKRAILSNGYFMDKERIEFLQKYPPRKIQISLYGSSDEAYEKVTGVRAFDRVYKNILMLRDSNLNTSVAITPNEYMVDDMYAIIDLVSSIGLPYSINTGLITPRSNTGRKKRSLELDKFIEMLQYSDKLKHLEHETVDLIDLPDENHEGREREGLLCGGARSGFTIKYDGTMSPCAALENLSSEPLKIGFQNAWNEIVQKADRYPIPQECEDCVYKPSCIHCVAMHKDAPCFGHCDPRICERTKKMISAGLLPMPKRNS